MKCPICNTEMVRDDDFMDFTLMEREDKCVAGCRRYVEHFVTGNYEIGVQWLGEWERWQWGYTTSPRIVETIRGQIECIAGYVRAELENEPSD